ncbi:hypothetical protein GCK72_009828 [Caenorhabditis remanei]|uniref:Uncharacterized protein n=1 Tax=Caenorhabditis remanei TaxID=31234 RepID=A0A6A5H536_CAERE|nr:hypothetical protein GCK72_009828 [Caenorhabditis remanei]KAF1761572.1 hypothetical protein GCK72_009828 [Caenorhabditis remanei]
MKTFLLLVILLCCETTESSECSCASGEVCVKGKCSDQSTLARETRSGDECGTCPPDTFCSNGQCIGYPWPVNSDSVGLKFISWNESVLLGKSQNGVIGLSHATNSSTDSVAS